MGLSSFLDLFCEAHEGCQMMERVEVALGLSLIKIMYCFFPKIPLYSEAMRTFFFKDFFLCGPFLKSSLNLLQYSFCFMFWFSGCEACGILALWPGIKPAPPAVEGKILTTGLPGKSLCVHFHFWDKVGEPQLVCSVSYSPWKYFLLSMLIK